jgi:DNA-binding Lrp family transcriptional regulator
MGINGRRFRQYAGMDAKDRAILRLLQRNARQSIMELADAVAMPRATVQDRVRKLERSGIIQQYTARLAYDRLGLPATAFVLISFLPGTSVSQRELAQQIAKLDGVFDVHVISGEWDILLKVRGGSIEDVGKIVIDRLRTLPGVGRTVTCTSFWTVKETT